MVFEAYLHVVESVDVKVSGTLEDETCSRFQSLWPELHGSFTCTRDSCAALNGMDLIAESD